MIQPALARAFARDERSRRRRSLAMLAPALIFALLFFLLPIAVFLLRAVDNREVHAALPRTAAAMAAWDGVGLPGEPAFAALAADLRALPDPIAAATLGRQLNAHMSGLRSMVVRAAARLPAEPRENWRATFLALDRRWEDPAVWTLLRHESGWLTPAYLLAALDRERGEAGRIRAAPPDRAIFLDLLARTLWICAAVTLICVVIAFPLAVVMARAGPRLGSWLLVLVLLPFWTSLLVRSTAWIILLQQQGLVNQGLLWLGLVGEPLALLYNRLGVLIAMTHVLLPLAVLPMYSVMRGLDRQALRAGASLGATPLRVFRSIYLPQVAPGVIAGAALVFVSALGYYITPELVGGPGDQMIAWFIAYFTADSVNWGMASALSLVLLGTVALAYLATARAVGPRRLRLRG